MGEPEPESEPVLAYLPALKVPLLFIRLVLGSACKLQSGGRLCRRSPLYLLSLRRRCRLANILIIMTGLSPDSFLGGVLEGFMGRLAGGAGARRAAGRRNPLPSFSPSQSPLFPCFQTPFPPPPAPCLPPRLYDSNPFKALGGVTSERDVTGQLPSHRRAPAGVREGRPQWAWPTGKAESERLEGIGGESGICFQEADGVGKRESRTK
ncbi:hypothetical protein E2C01_064549 [Portunus trituberculatus]|uniref:Uncharacterized protein n=1 Tax=Portunus trituberculatus TaxID=210409 RepID=A0A5B7HL49_PORTR|nr:hypothetical protein [Portunus trituberculatus]